MVFGTVSAGSTGAGPAISYDSRSVKAWSMRAGSGGKGVRGAEGLKVRLILWTCCSGESGRPHYIG